jgi:tyrosinase
MVAGYSRRHLLTAGAAGLAGTLIPFPEWLSRYGTAEAGPPLTRYGVSTPQGAAMLASYRSAVATMMGRGEGNPCSWLFQWYTHQIRADRTKSTEIASLPAAQRPLATDMWNTCQAHNGRPVRFFLPWHRMYVYFLERIVRAASGNPNFTLPYWDYLTPSQRALPGPFWNSTVSALYRPSRNAGSNAGSPIDQGQPAGTINQDCMSETDYLPTPGKLGFCSAINGSPHGIVHSLVGNSIGMGNVPWAANDPIFWLHHCNIDRMWASWNAWGRTNPSDPSWLHQQFVFADENCNRVLVTVSDFASIANLGYRYDRLIPRFNLALLERFRELTLIAKWRPGPDPGPERLGVALGAGAVRVSLTPAGGRKELLSARSLASAHVLRINVRNLRTNVLPGILYDLYLNLPVNARAQATQANFIGAITFFDAVAGDPREHGDMQMEPSEGPSFTFDVTRLVKRLKVSDRLDVTIVPHGKPAAEAKPVIGDIELVGG